MLQDKYQSAVKRAKRRLVVASEPSSVVGSLLVLVNVALPSALSAITGTDTTTAATMATIKRKRKKRKSRQTVSQVISNNCAKIKREEEVGFVNF